MKKTIKNIKKYCENNQGKLVYLVFSFNSVTCCGETEEEYEDMIDKLAKEYENGIHRIHEYCFEPLDKENRIGSLHMYHNLIDDIYEIDEELVNILLSYISIQEDNPLDNKHFRKVYIECFERLSEYSDKEVLKIVKEMEG